MVYNEILREKSAKPKEQDEAPTENKTTTKRQVGGVASGLGRFFGRFRR